METALWREILVTDKRRNHASDVVTFCKSARDRLTELALDDRDELTSLRLAGKARVWGFFDALDGAFYVVWFDPNHKVCPSQKKHT